MYVNKDVYYIKFCRKGFGAQTLVSHLFSAHVLAIIDHCSKLTNPLRLNPPHPMVDIVFV